MSVNRCEHGYGLGEACGECGRHAEADREPGERDYFLARVVRYAGITTAEELREQLVEVRAEERTRTTNHIAEAVEAALVPNCHSMGHCWDREQEQCISCGARLPPTLDDRDIKPPQRGAVVRCDSGYDD